VVELDSKAVTSCKDTSFVACGKMNPALWMAAGLPLAGTRDPRHTQSLLLIGQLLRAPWHFLRPVLQQIYAAHSFSACPCFRRTVYAACFAPSADVVSREAILAVS